MNYVENQDKPIKNKPKNPICSKCGKEMVEDVHHTYFYTVCEHKELVYKHEGKKVRSTSDDKRYIQLEPEE